MSLTRRLGLGLVAASLACALFGGIATAGAPPDPPDDVYPAVEDQDLVVSAPGVLVNDGPAGTMCVTTFDADDLDGSLVSGVAVDGSFTYRPTANWNGTTSFTYGVAVLVADVCPDAIEDTATVTITVASVNDAPTALPDTFFVLADRTLIVNAPGVLANDSDIDGDTLSAKQPTSPAHGVVILAADGGFSYTPVTGFTGVDHFSYQATDGTDSSAGVVTLNVIGIPTPRPTVAPPTIAPPTDVPPSAAPSMEATVEPLASGSPEPSASLDPNASPAASGAATPAASGDPGSSPDPEPAAGSGGLSIPALVVLLLLLSLLAAGAAVLVPKWLESRRTGRGLD